MNSPTPDDDLLMTVYQQGPIHCVKHPNAPLIRDTYWAVPMYRCAVCNDEWKQTHAVANSSS